MVEPVLPPDHPITDIFIVSEKSYSESGYQVIEKTTDESDADLWKDSFFSKTKRYFCFTRKLPTPDGSNTMVLKDLAIIKENDVIPMNYTALNQTKDTSEQCLKKKKVVVQYENRFTSGSAICEVYLTKNSKQKVAESSCKGEINGLTLSVRYGTGPKIQQKVTQQLSTPPEPQPKPVPAPRTNLPSTTHLTTVKRSGTMRAIQLHNQPLDGVTFDINSAFKALLNTNTNFTVPNLNCLTSEQIEEKYKYDFQTEKIAEKRLIQS
ncbi:multivesicular body subunit 12B-like [Anneissia japonica]|uniref:multivesicular body subunit 12B-like n=1 Tax=Anneissia japonica TaxID=1529436 RepID=UPI001425A301|nr:multivesicular body subunit 12B-like [Anneissia japonica]